MNAWERADKKALRYIDLSEDQKDTADRVDVELMSRKFTILTVGIRAEFQKYTQRLNRLESQPSGILFVIGFIVYWIAPLRWLNRIVIRATLIG